MESDYNKPENDKKPLNEERVGKDLIKVRAKISCPNCGTEKSFKNQFKLSNLELMVVALKVFDWLTCNKCGDLLKLDLEFKI